MERLPDPQYVNMPNFTAAKFHNGKLIYPKDMTNPEEAGPFLQRIIDILNTAQLKNNQELEDAYYVNQSDIIEMITFVCKLLNDLVNPTAAYTTEFDDTDPEYGTDAILLHNAILMAALLDIEDEITQAVPCEVHITENFQLQFHFQKDREGELFLLSPYALPLVKNIACTERQTISVRVIEISCEDRVDRYIAYAELFS